MALTANLLGHQALDEIQRFHQAFRRAFIGSSVAPSPIGPARVGRRARSSVGRPWRSLFPTKFDQGRTRRDLCVPSPSQQANALLPSKVNSGSMPCCWSRFRMLQATSLRASLWNQNGNGDADIQHKLNMNTHTIGGVERMQNRKDMACGMIGIVRPCPIKSKRNKPLPHQIEATGRGLAP